MQRSKGERSMKKKISLRIIRICIALTLVVAGFLCYAAMCPSHDARTEQTIGYRNEEYKDSEIWYIGNSNMKTGVIPDVVFNETGLKGYNSGEAYASVKRVYNITKDGYKYQSPKLVVIETDMLIDPVSNSKSEELIEYKNIFDRFYYNHDFWIKKAQTDTISKRHGYKMKKSKYSGKSDYKKKNRQTHFLEENKQIMNQMLDVIKGKGSEVLFITLPAFNHLNETVLNEITSYIKDKGEKHIDYSNFDTANLNIETTMGEVNHLNISGAYKVSLHLSNYIKKEFSIKKNGEHEKFAKESKNFIRKYSNKF